MVDGTSNIIFRDRPKTCAGDMRIAWRLALILLALHYSRGQKASFAKLHVLNDALRSKTSQEKLERILGNTLPMISWRLRVEPAFTRALDFLVGEGLAEWSVASKRTILQLTSKGVEAAKEVVSEDDILVDERQFLNGAAKGVTETFVQRLLMTGKQLL